MMAVRMGRWELLVHYSCVRIVRVINVRFPPHTFFMKSYRMFALKTSMYCFPIYSGLWYSCVCSVEYFDIFVVIVVEVFSV